MRLSRGKIMSKAQIVLKDMLIHQMHHTPQHLNMDGKDPETFLTETLDLFTKDTDELFAVQVEKMHEVAEEIHQEEKAFLEKDLSLWQDSFAGIRLLYQNALEIESTVNEQMREIYAEEKQAQEEEPHTLEVTRYIHSRVCQLFYETTILLEHGMVEGAYTLWYKMHELCCCLLFIHSSKNPEKLAMAYIKYAHEDNGRHLWAKSDKRVASSKGTYIPFHRIEALCGSDSHIVTDEAPYTHLQAQGSEYMLHSKDTPLTSLGREAFELEVVAFSAIRTLISVTEQLVFTTSNVKMLLVLHLMEVWEEKLEDMLIHAAGAYEDFKEAEINIDKEDI